MISIHRIILRLWELWSIHSTFVYKTLDSADKRCKFLQIPLLFQLTMHCLDPKEFKKSGSGPWPKKIVHHCYINEGANRNVRLYQGVSSWEISFTGSFTHGMLIVTFDIFEWSDFAHETCMPRWLFELLSALNSSMQGNDWYGIHFKILPFTFRTFLGLVPTYFCYWTTYFGSLWLLPSFVGPSSSSCSPISDCYC